ncbi:hypothetical protein Dimus_010689 [Dionaea muscipula]
MLLGVLVFLVPDFFFAWSCLSSSVRDAYSKMPPSVYCPSTTTSTARSPYPVAFSVTGLITSTVIGGPSSRLGWLSVAQMKLSASDFDDVGCEILDLRWRGTVGLWLLDSCFA